jgi:hypothetical protein
MMSSKKYVERLGNDMTDMKCDFMDFHLKVDGSASHVRPYGRNAQDKVKTPDGSMVIDCTFLLNAELVQRKMRGGAVVKLQPFNNINHGNGPFDHQVR